MSDCIPIKRVLKTGGFAKARAGESQEESTLGKNFQVFSLTRRYRRDFGY